MPATRRFIKTVAGQMPRHPFYLLVVFGLAVCAYVVAAALWMLTEQRDAAIKAAGTNLRNLSQVVADQTDRVIDSVERAEDRLLDHLASDGAMSVTGRSQLQVVMRDIITGMAQAYALVLVDANGNLVNFSYEVPVPERNLADRSYFQFALAHPEVKRFISETIISRQSHRPTFYVVRRLTGPDGTFTGLLLGAVQADYLERLFAASTLPAGGSVTLLRADGGLLVRHPSVPLEAMQGREAEFRASFSSADHGAIRRTGVFDGVERLTAISSLPRHSLKVAVSVPFSAVVASWQIEASRVGGIAALGCLATAITVFLAIRRFHDQRRLEAAAAALKVDEEHRRAEREIAEQHARFGMALDNMSQGLAMFDRSDRLLLANAATARIFELEPWMIRAGMTLAELIVAVSHLGNVSEHVTKVIDFYQNLVRHNKATKFVRKLPNGRQMTSGFVPYDDGYLFTFEDVTALGRADARITHMAMHDALTGLPNRDMLRIRIEEASAAIYGNGGFAVMCLDLDNFKDVNASMGHPAGDRLLCQVAQRIQSVTRRSEVVVRLGGDEFAVVAFPGDDAAGVAKLAARLVESVGVPYDVDNQTVVISISIGIAMAPADGTGPDTLMKNADLALYHAKSNGPGCYAFFESSMEQHLVERRRVETELRNALVLGELELYYQPIVRVATRRIVGFEALLRWRHPTRGMVAPDEFIPIAEANGSILQIGEWVLNRACLEAARWRGTPTVAVNLSSVQFHNGHLVETVATALDASGLAADRLELEITESAMMENTEATVTILKEIKALGVRIAMDDFGTGYSSLAYLQRFPFDKVKIDQAFVRDIGQTANLAIVKAVTSIAEKMGIETIAEGVETEAQFARVAGEGCHQVQGYLFSRPRPASEIAAMLAQEDAPRAEVAADVADLAS